VILFLISRTCRITALTALFLPAFFLCCFFRPGVCPAILRRYLQSCGGGFVKAGQVLAMRYDLLPGGYCKELSKLLDRLPPLPASRIIPVVERDLGKRLSECFAEFEDLPLASASIAQVHGARLHTGESVVVKVVRPGMRTAFRVDLFYLRWAGSVLDNLTSASRLGVRRVIDEIVQLTQEELDFRREARNLDLMHARMQADDIDHYAPRLFPELCGGSVLTMERIQGVVVTELIAAVISGDDTKLSAWAEKGITPRRTARILMRSLLEQTMRHRLFHADPHASNLIVMPGGTLAWVDFGMLGSIDERLWALQFKMRAAVGEGNVHAAYQYLLATLEPIPPRDLSGFEASIKEYLSDWIASSESGMASIQEKSSGRFFLHVFAALRRTRLRLPLGLMRLYRTIIIGDIAMLGLDPRIDWLPILRDFIREEQTRQTWLLFKKGFSLSLMGTSLDAVIQAPGTAIELMNWVRNGLPEKTRFYRRWLSTGERVTYLLFQYFRLLLWILTLGLLSSRFVAPRLFPGGRWVHWAVEAHPPWWILAVGGVAGIALLGRILREFDESR
jgi:ubiquinone biosynthesis protein